MKAEILRKLDEHLKSLIGKPELTNEEYMLLRSELDRIEMKEAQAAAKLRVSERNDALQTMLDVLKTMEGE